MKCVRHPFYQRVNAIVVILLLGVGRSRRKKMHKKKVTLNRRKSPRKSPWTGLRR